MSSESHLHTTAYEPHDIFDIRDRVAKVTAEALLKELPFSAADAKGRQQLQMGFNGSTLSITYDPQETAFDIELRDRNGKPVPADALDVRLDNNGKASVNPDDLLRTMQAIGALGVNTGRNQQVGAGFGGIGKTGK